MHRDEYYEDIITRWHANRKKGIQKGVQNAKDRLAAAKSSGIPGAISAEQANLAVMRGKIVNQDHLLKKEIEKYQTLSKEAVKSKTCSCPPVAPSPPCDVYYRRPRAGTKRREQQQDSIEAKWYSFKRVQQQKLPADRIPPLKNMKLNDQVNHLTPKQAGGCPTGQGNLTLDKALQCPACRKLEEDFKEFQKRGVDV
jgi:hypothetical protein